jgi:hypothetical protein
LMGWIKQPGKPCFIDFGLKDPDYYKNTISYDQNGNRVYEAFWLDFNVQGVVYDKL